MHSDHRHPGSSVSRAADEPPMRTTSTLDLSGVRVSSGESKSRDSTPATGTSFLEDWAECILAPAALTLQGLRGDRSVGGAGGRRIDGVMERVDGDLLRAPVDRRRGYLQ